MEQHSLVDLSLSSVTLQSVGLISFNTMKIIPAMHLNNHKVPPRQMMISSVTYRTILKDFPIISYYFP